MTPNLQDYVPASSSNEGRGVFAGEGTLRADCLAHCHECTNWPRTFFRNAEITADVLLASACLPTMFRAIEIDGEAYWDGGFAGNPTITPLIRETDAHDSILVQINPRERSDTPRTATDILNRLNEISFNSPLMKELRMIALLRQVADPGPERVFAGRRCAHIRS